MWVEKNDAIKVGGGGGASMLGDLSVVWAPASEEAKYVTLDNCPLFLLVAPDPVECGGPSFNWVRQT